MTTPVTLAERHAETTQALILSAAIDLLEESTVPDLTVRAVAARAGMSERTVFRHHPARGDFLDAVAGEVVRRLALPPLPSSVDDWLDYVGQLFARYEAKSRLTEAALHTDLFVRIHQTAATARWAAVQAVVDAYAPRRSAQERKLAAANIRYLLSATTWHYYRARFGLTQDETVAGVRLAVDQSLRGLATTPRR